MGYNLIALKVRIPYYCSMLRCEISKVVFQLVLKPKCNNIGKFSFESKTMAPLK